MLRRARQAAAIVIQSHWRGSIQVTLFWRQRKAVIIIQACWRAFAIRRRPARVQAATVIQACWRAFARRRLAAVTILQARWRSVLARRVQQERQRQAEERARADWRRVWAERLEMVQRQQAVTRIQAAFRGHVCRQRFIGKVGSHCSVVTACAASEQSELTNTADMLQAQMFVSACVCF